MSDFADMIHPYKAHIRRAMAGERNAALLAALQATGLVDDDVLSERAPFFWAAEISNDLVDAYFTHMTVGTLSNFVADAKAGVSFLNSHRHDELPLGRSLDARMESDGDKVRALADFYTLPGLNLNGLSTNDFIDGVRAGIVSDVSVGFHGGTHTCDLCGNDYYSYRCPHLAGLRYEVREGDTVRMVLATVTIDNARLSEVSAVFDGATPEASIVKARRMAEAGELKANDIQLLEARYRVRLPQKRTIAGAQPERSLTVDYEKIVTDIRAALKLDEQADVAGAVTGLAAEAEQLRKAGEQVTALEQRIKELELVAADGRMYRTDLVADAMAEGVRAHGEKFDADTYRTLLESSPLAVIKRMRDDWAVLGAERFPRGRQTLDQSEAPVNGNQAAQRMRVPDRAFAV